MTAAFTVREAVASDAEFLASMLVEAVYWRPADPARPDDARRSADALLADPVVAKYVTGWPLAGDAGVVAEEQGRPVGAAWWRHFTTEHHGFGFVDDATPELSIAVTPEARGRGVGSALLRVLIEQARRAGLPALSLSVETDNPAARLYLRQGFAVVEQQGGAFTMVHTFGDT